MRARMGGGAQGRWACSDAPAPVRSVLKQLSCVERVRPGSEKYLSRHISKSVIYFTFKRDLSSLSLTRYSMGG